MLESEFERLWRWAPVPDEVRKEKGAWNYGSPGNNFTGTDNERESELSLSDIRRLNSRFTEGPTRRLRPYVIKANPLFKEQSGKEESDETPGQSKYVLREGRWAITVAGRIARRPDSHDHNWVVKHKDEGTLPRPVKLMRSMKRDGFMPEDWPVENVSRDPLEGPWQVGGKITVFSSHAEWEDLDAGFIARSHKTPKT
ncbi:MAG: hypothetical protein PHV63_01290 [Candidatus Daviesbacteria bacterium]|nr:hypothetical protein [Candidatus Daviesbacteria bacterium]